MSLVLSKGSLVLTGPFKGASPPNPLQERFTLLSGPQICSLLGVTTDNEQNVIVTGYITEGSPYNAALFLAKFKPSGGISWQRTLGGVGSEFGYAVATYNSDIYVIGSTRSVTEGLEDILIAKYNSAGAIQWQRSLGDTHQEFGYDIATDNAGNVYVTGSSYDPSTIEARLVLAKYNSSGTLQWQRLVTGDDHVIGHGATIDSNNNIYVVGHWYTGAGSAYDVWLAKYDSDGALTWQKTFGHSFNDFGQDYGYAITMGADDSTIFIAGGVYYSSTSNYNILVARFNDSGTLQWYQGFTSSGLDSDVGNGIVADSSNNVYVHGTVSESSSDWVTLKTNSSGTLQWARSTGNTSRSYFGNDIAIDSGGNIYAVGKLDDDALDDHMLVAKLPIDGSGTGNYVFGAGQYDDFDYQSITLTVQEPSMAASNGSLVDSAGGLTANTTSLTSKASNVTVLTL
jgi:uncharacterized delta-60 repeat protein